MKHITVKQFHSNSNSGVRKQITENLDESVAKPGTPHKILKVGFKFRSSNSMQAFSKAELLQKVQGKEEV